MGGKILIVSGVVFNFAEIPKAITARAAPRKEEDLTILGGESLSWTDREWPLTPMQQQHVTWLIGRKNCTNQSGL